MTGCWPASLMCATARRRWRFAAEVAEWAPSPLGMVFNNAGVATSQSVAEGSVEDDEWVHRDQLPGRGQRRARVPADPAGSGLRGDRQHLERVRAARDALPERLLRVEVRRPRLHRFIATGAAGDRCARHHASTRAGSRRTSPATPATTLIRLGPDVPHARRSSGSTRSP